MVRGRRSERLNGVRVSTDRTVDGRRTRSPLMAERHILLKADKVTVCENDFSVNFLYICSDKNCR